ncbi:vWA domain-containing protein [Roseofilum casamattae]|uniref:VWA domain-containing protein n=1 Tax=Roseofilum casamattae BLCC-M143 TaxID=3022442 RepID=A0ABT7BXC4_9CYAN|nr:vWA domain-containing protein [Roseofilum casamattae]MDJ1182948.1 VWA domain-containing protein [Roseofilum casamattae BLCC-M143]
MQLTNVVDPFGEVNVYKRNTGDLNIVATILTVPDLEGTRVGLALDGSASMKKMYGISGVLSSGIFGNAAGTPNVVEPVARTMVNYLANFSSNGKVDTIYWACSPDGSQVEELGAFDDKEIQNVSVAGPKHFPWGRGTKLLPPLEYFVEKFKDAPALGTKRPAAFCLFITDGIIEDLEAVKNYCFQYAREITDRKKPFIKLLLIGVGDEVDRQQMEDLDDMFEGSGIKDSDGKDIDIWDHQLASDMTKLEQVFKEFVSEDMMVIGSGRIVNQNGKVCHEYADGVPALLQFTLPAGSHAFSLEFPGGSVTQDISEGLATP